ncbi:MAG: MBL fold metallo-hydrolase [Candidatus Hatepunaea meridiana]|nr:MBL fold metallo-hydrolase [Candidatus Hatepunaea meridiana]
MKVKFWGVRGSIATPLTNIELNDKIKKALELALKAGLNAPWQTPQFIEQLPWYIRKTAGGDTTCVEVETGDNRLIFDAGTGIRPLGLNLMRQEIGKPIEASILLSHTHWDHICGLPFFVPAYIPNNNITIYGTHSKIEDRIRHQQDFEYFPVPLDIMRGIKEFVQLREGESFRIGDIEIDTISLYHPGGCTGYKVSYNGKTIIYATDSEYKELSPEPKPIIDFFRDADLVIFDAQYTMLENIEKEDWGHSSTIIGIDMALKAGVKKLAFTHHEPTYSDEKLWDIFQKAQNYLELQSEKNDLQLYLAYEGLSISL